ncbi:GNAT family N-acetyltransferase [Candidatus Enterococcus ikei]|uniref:GNAT family N-acetyltransferase n=1 Tax=Candidatus Enterococcus ikei TaxID=2815326 RepID=A0ABS3GUI4_9ENTE|nr:GNAT family N-acetyltransferase [Enterococcus sp. DIV0869a]MBO0438820.1 GNAT family N-acetyltransferase [Enterococcus sp. DIV0869a]
MKQLKATKKEYKNLVEIWSKSVKQTHDFLQIEDFKTIKKELSTYFPHLDVQIWLDQEKNVGFSGVDGNKLEMLFLDPQYIGKGYGKQIVMTLIEEKGIQFVDVNEQNKSAKAFYQAMGFEEYERSEVDDAGRAYPILHLKRE